MFVVIIRFIFIISGAIAAIQAGNFIGKTFVGEELGVLPYGLLFIIFVGLGYVTGGVIGRKITSIVGNLVANISRHSTVEILSGTIGLVIGLFIAALISYPVSLIDYVGTYLSIMIFVIVGYFGLLTAIAKSSEFNFLKIIMRQGESPSKIKKIVDTSAIIDGRILDICKTGFLEGPLIVPRFIINELHALADSDDDLKRTRARRGIDLLKELKQGTLIDVLIDEADYPSIDQADLKLIKMAKEMKASLVTNDFNLNKVAQLENIIVLNVNELSNAVKPVLYPGEKMLVKIVKEGKERYQGISYLDDGTMVVIEDTRDKIGREVEFVVTSVIQTQAGRMIFGKLPESDGSS